MKITIEQLNEIEDLIRDLRMALEFKEHMDRKEPFVILPTREPITIVFDKTKKAEVETKISLLKEKLKEKLRALIVEE